MNMRWVRIGQYEYQYEGDVTTGKYRHVLLPDVIHSYL